jgi:hypothetical protein
MDSITAPRRNSIFIDDDLADISTTITPEARLVVAPTAATSVAQPVMPPAAELDGTEFNFGDDKFKSQSRLPRIKNNNKGEVARFFLVGGVKARAKETHFIAGTGTFQCLKPSTCPVCLKGEASRLRIVCLGVKYTNADLKTGKLGNQKPEYEVGWLCLSRANYSQITSLPEEGSTVYDIDLKMGNSTRAFGYEFTVASSVAAYTKVGDEKVIAGLVAPYLDGVDLAKKLGKKASAGELRAALSGVGGIIDTSASLGDIEDLD